MLRCRVCCCAPASTPLAPELEAQIRGEKRSIWCVKDGCGMVCATVTWLLILYADYVVVTCMLLPAPSSAFSYFHGIFFHSLVFLGICSHLRAMLSDPGTVPMGNATRENILKLGLKQGSVVIKCPKCNCIKPERAHHCSVCKRCVKRMDHHCPWVNNCVGENNQKFFVLFTMYICASSVYSILICINYVIMCSRYNWEGCWVAQQSPGYVLCTVFMLIEAVIFGMFTCCMFVDQMCSIWRDETGIETLKKEKPSGQRSRSWMNMHAVFGNRLSIWWLLPCASPRGAYERIVRMDDVESCSGAPDTV